MSDSGHRTAVLLGSPEEQSTLVRGSECRGRLNTLAFLLFPFREASQTALGVGVGVWVSECLEGYLSSQGSRRYSGQRTSSAYLTQEWF